MMLQPYALDSLNYQKAACDGSNSFNPNTFSKYKIVNVANKFACL